MYAENCDKSVLKRILKQLWRIVMKSVERNIVLPPIETKVILMLQITVIKLFMLKSSRALLFIFLPTPDDDDVAAKGPGEGFVWAGECVGLGARGTDRRRQAGRQECDERGLGESQLLRRQHNSSSQNTQYFLRQDNLKEGEKSLSPKQCAVLECGLDQVKQYFHAGGNGEQHTDIM